MLLQVLIDVGLCISFYDLLEVDDPYIYPAEGSAHQRVKFRLGIVYYLLFNVYFIFCIYFLSNCGMYGILVVFRPFIGEVLTGKVLSCKEDGVRGMQMKCK